MSKPEKPIEAFERYIGNPIIQKAMEMSGESITKSLLQDCFMAGAGYAIERCKAEHHQPNKTSH